MNMPFVEIVGAGPGAEDLITVRGLRALQQADLVVYAGSLVAPALLRHCRPDCLCRDSASMDLAEQVAVMSEAALAGKRVVRLHTGDPPFTAPSTNRSGGWPNGASPCASPLA